MAEVSKSPNDSLRMRKIGETKSPREYKSNDNNTVMQYDDPCHHVKDSILSSSTEFTNFRGLLNLGIVLLILSNARTALLNVINYGILIDPRQWIKLMFENPFHRPTFYLGLCANVFILFSLFIEHGLSSGRFTHNKGLNLIIANILTLLIAPLIVIGIFDCNPIFSSIVCSLNSVIALKLVSYHQVNYWCRTKFRYGREIMQKQPKTGEKIVPIHTTKLVVYPNNLIVSDIYYFMFAPTLCYQLNFPRTDSIRIGFLFKRIIECSIYLQISLSLIQQWMVPAIQNSLQPFNDMNYSKMVERCLNLAVPNHIIWLMFFYSYFHSFLNLIAEILRFGDREFYKEWWNSESVNDFWKNWNIPVHKWCVRHVFKPLIYRGFNVFQASFVVFLISAFFHEYVVSVPLKMFRLWAFTAMLAQIPFMIIVEKCLKGHYANCAIWMSLIIGQPLAILMYYHDYYVMHLTK